MSNKSNQNQGEGDRESARQFNKAQKSFAESGKVDETAAERRASLSQAQRDELERAEREGKSRAKEKDPNVVRDHDDSTK